MIDTHLHILNPGLIDYGWLKQMPPLLQREYAPEHIEKEAKAGSITHALLVQAANQLAETKYLISEAKKHAWISGVVGWVDLLEPEGLQETLDSLDSSSLKGVRHLSHIEENERWLLQPAVLDSLRILEKRGLVLDVVGTNITHLDCTIQLAETFSRLKIVVDHLNQPPADATQMAHWQEKMIMLSQNKNAYLKISGLGTLLNKGEEWSTNDILPCIKFCLEHFGQHRILLGSDWPICLLAGDYQTTMKKYEAALYNFPTNVQEAVKFRNAIQVYQLQMEVS